MFQMSVAQYEVAARINRKGIIDSPIVIHEN